MKIVIVPKPGLIIIKQRNLVKCSQTQTKNRKSSPQQGNQRKLVRKTSPQQGNQRKALLDLAATRLVKNPIAKWSGMWKGRSGIGEPCGNYVLQVVWCCGFCVGWWQQRVKCLSKQHSHRQKWRSTLPVAIPWRIFRQTATQRVRVQSKAQPHQHQ